MALTFPKQSFIIISLSILFLFPEGICQTVGKNEVDLRKVRVEDLSDQQIVNYIQQAQASGLTLDQLEAAARARGMQPAEIIKLRQRIDSLQYIQTAGTEDNRFIDRTRSLRFGKSTQSDDKKLLLQGKQISATEEKTFNDLLAEQIFSSTFLAEKKKELSLEEKLFGFFLFNNEKITFEPSLNLPTPLNYILGPGDEIIIDIWGASEKTYRQIVSPEGTIIISNLGPIPLAGMTIGEATERLKRRLTAIYNGLKEPSPNTFMSLTLGQIRSIKINLVGEVKVPGTYTLPSVATVLNALYAAGGPSLNGTLRNVQLIRNNKTIAQIDFYKFLLEGRLPDDLRLEDQDVIFIQPYSRRVEVTGEVKRPGLYDLTDNEVLHDLIKFTGGFTGKAYNQKVKVIRMNGREKEIYDVPITASDSFPLINGDLIMVDSVLNRFANKVEIRGAVFREGIFSLDDSLTIRKLIAKAEGLRGDAFLNRAAIYRTREDFTIEVIPVDLGEIFSNDAHDILLQKDDFVLIPSHFDITEDYSLQIEGDVKRPGVYPYAQNMTVEDLILQAGGLLESASRSVLEVARRLNDQTTTQSTAKIASIYRFPISSGLQLPSEGSAFVLQPFDHVYVRRSPAYQNQKTVTLEGEFVFPGKYALSSKEERISDLINRAGGLTPFAYPEGARLIRKTERLGKEKYRIIQNLLQSSGDTLTESVFTQTETAIGIELGKILNNPGSDYDLLMEEGDVLQVPKKLETVKLSGALLYPTTVKYKKNYSFNDYISNAGGLTDDARKSKAFVIYPNGSVEMTKKILFFNAYPAITPGSEIIVPKKAIKEKASPAQTISIASALASMSLIIVSLINNIKW